MTVDRMREEIIKVYPGPGWRKRVLQMKENQVIAIYKSMSRGDVFRKKAKEQKKKEKMKEQGVQMTIWDFMKEY